MPVAQADAYAVAPQPTIAIQIIDAGQPIVGTGTGTGSVQGSTVVFTVSGEEIGRTSVQADLTWSALLPLSGGETDVSVTERDPDGWTGTLPVPTIGAADGAQAAPARGVLSSDSGWANGLKGGDFRITMNLWWGENASSFRLYENGEVILTNALTPSSPRVQSIGVAITGRAKGVYVYTGVLVNSRGTTQVTPITIDVTNANPGMPVLSHDNWDADGSFTVTAEM